MFKGGMFKVKDSGNEIIEQIRKVTISLPQINSIVRLANEKGLQGVRIKSIDFHEGPHGSLVPVFNHEP